MAALEYLTVQDVLWINLKVTGKVLPFDYARVEEATYYQYGYGQSVDLMAQAARTLKRFGTKRPFPAGNDATGFVLALAFLEMNGKAVDLDPSEAVAWYTSALAGDTQAQIEAKAVEASDHHPAAREVCGRLIERYGSALQTLVQDEAPAAITPA